MTDITFLGNTGPAFILLFAFFGVLVVCKIIDVVITKSRHSISIASETGIKTTQQKSCGYKIVQIIVDRFKWNYSNDIVFVTYYYLTIFSMCQMLNFSEKSGFNYVSNFFSVVFILFAIAVPILIVLIIRSNSHQISESKTHPLPPLRCFYYRANH